MLQFCFLSKKKKKKKGEDVTILRDTVTTSWSADDICFLILKYISCWSDILVLYVFSSTLSVLACYSYTAELFMEIMRIKGDDHQGKKL